MTLVSLLWGEMESAREMVATGRSLSGTNNLRSSYSWAFTSSPPDSFALPFCESRFRVFHLPCFFPLCDLILGLGNHFFGGGFFCTLYESLPFPLQAPSFPPWSIKALIAWKSLISSGFVRAPWSAGVSDGCGRRITIRQHDGGRKVHLDQLAERAETASFISLGRARIKGRASHGEEETFLKSLKVWRWRGD